MPFYEVLHALPLSEAQQDKLAEAITHIHTRLFTVPAGFVHVAFTNTDARPMYMAGKRRRSNMIVANIRNGPSRTSEHFSQLCNQVGDAWKTTVAGTAEKYVQTEENKLRAVFVLGTIVAAWEGGFMAPNAGEDKEWFQKNMPAMKKAAVDGDTDIADMLEELKTREDFKGLLTNGS